MDMLYALLFIGVGVLVLFVLLFKLLSSNDKMYTVGKKGKKSHSSERTHVNEFVESEKKNNFISHETKDKSETVDPQDELFSKRANEEIDLSSCSEEDKKDLEKNGVKFYDE